MATQEQINNNALEASDSYDWSLGCDVTVVHEDATIEEIRVNDILLSGIFVKEELSVEIDDATYSNIELGVNVALGGFNVTGVGKIEKVYNVQDFGKEFHEESFSDTFNAHAINSLHRSIVGAASDIKTLESDLLALRDSVIEGGNINEESLAAITNAINKKADKATTLSGYGITDAYTQEDVDNLLKKYLLLDAPSQTVKGNLRLDGNLLVSGNILSDGQVASATVGAEGSGGGFAYFSDLFDVNVDTRSKDDLISYDGERWVNIKRSEIKPDLSNYAEKSFVTSQGYITSASLDPYIKEDVADSKYATKGELNTNIDNRLSTWEGTNNINTVGTIKSGTWNGGKITNDYIANPQITIADILVPLGGSISKSDLAKSLGLDLHESILNWYNNVGQYLKRADDGTFYLEGDFFTTGQLAATVVGEDDGNGGAFAYLSDLLDVTIASISSGDLLSWNGSEWVNIKQSSIVPNLSAYIKESVADARYATQESLNEGLNDRYTKKNVDDLFSNFKGTENITTLGTITKGVWNGTAIANEYLANSKITISGIEVALGGSISQESLRTGLGLDAILAWYESVGVKFQKQSDDTIYVDGNLVTGGQFAAMTAGEGSGSIGATNLSDLFDVSVSALTSGDLLSWNGSEWVNIKKSTLAPDLSAYATKSFVTSQGYITSEALASYATKNDFITALLPYATAETVNKVAGRVQTLEEAGYATETFVTTRGYITSTALSPYITKDTADGSYATIDGLDGLNSRLTAIEDYFYTVDDAESKIDKWNEIVAFLDATEGTTLAGILAVYETKENIANTLKSYATTASLAPYAKTADVNNTLKSYATTASLNTLAGRVTTLEGKATAVSFSQSLTSGKQIGVLTIDGVAKSLYAPSMYDWSEINAKPTKLSQFTDDVVAGKYQPLATAINTSNIGEQMVGYAQRAGSAVDSETLGGLAPEMFAKNLNNATGINIDDTTFIGLRGGKTFAATGTFGYDGYSPFLEFGADGYTVQMQGRDGAFYARTCENKIWGNWKTLIHSGNVGSYALPLSGGTLTGEITIQTDSGDRFFHAIGGSAHLGFGVGTGGDNRGVFDFGDGKWWLFRNNSDETRLSCSYFYTDGNVLIGTTTDSGYKLDVNGSFNATSGYINGNTIIHSGNILNYAVGYNGHISLENDVNVLGYGYADGGWTASGSAFIVGADKSYRMAFQGFTDNYLTFNYCNDGTWGTWRKIAFTDSNVASADYATSANYATRTACLEEKEILDFTSQVGSSRIEAWHNWGNPTETSFAQYTHGIVAFSLDGNVYHYLGFANAEANPRVRSFSYGADSGWKTIAFVDDNVASATKLQTARSLWGNSFDGTSDIGSNLYYEGTTFIYLSTGFTTFGNTARTTYIDGNGISFNASGAENVLITTSGNVIARNGITTNEITIGGVRIDVANGALRVNVDVFSTGQFAAGEAGGVLEYESIVDALGYTPANQGNTYTKQEVNNLLSQSSGSVGNNYMLYEINNSSHTIPNGVNSVIVDEDNVLYFGLITPEDTTKPCIVYLVKSDSYNLDIVSDSSIYTVELDGTLNNEFSVSGYMGVMLVWDTNNYRWMAYLQN